MSRPDVDGSLVGGRVASYRVESLIGRGAMGTVYLAGDARLKRRVALKVLAPEFRRREAFRQRFLRESRIAAGLDHPNVVPVYDAGEAAGVLYLAMRYVEGSDLRALLRRAGPLAPRRALAIVAQVARALDAAHARGLVHRDVKPGNVLIAEDEHAYLSDFGVSLELDAAAMPGAHPGTPLGTVAYLAPEQIDSGPIDGRADVYGLACVLHECLCGEPPFVRGSDMAVLWAHLEDDARPISEARPGLPAAFDAVVARGLAKDPRERFATCQAMIEAARAVLSEADPVALPAALAGPSPPLIGRESEAVWLREAWQRAQHGAGGLVLLSGPRGSGKTRLAAELARIAQAAGATVRYASGIGAHEPGCRVLAASLASDGPALAVIEDLDAAHGELLEALRAAAVAIVNRPVLVLGTARDMNDAPLPAEHRRLGPLSGDAIGELTGLYAGPHTAVAPAERIARATGGMPGPAHELAAEWARSEAARRLHASADHAAAERARLRDAEANLADDVLELQLVRERARLFFPEVQPSTRPLPACPFMGLTSFDRADADLFFGRERLVAELVAALAGSSFLALVGPSGSGKSSVLRAGLLPALAGGVLPGSEGWHQRVLRPADDAATLAALGRQNVWSERRLIAVDQFEELFTAGMAEDTRADIAASLAAQADAGAVVVIALRADFYGRCSAYPELARLVAEHHVLVAPMQPSELRRTIELPAARAGLQIDPDLADALVRDVSGAAGGLPLLSTALLELWGRRRDARLTLDAYQSSGGVRGAVARLAEAAYAELSEPSRDACRRLLLRLATEEPGVGLVRRRAPLSELDLDRREDTRTVLTALTDRRLVTVGEHGAEVAHEALLQEWPRLRDWLQADAESRAVRQHLAAAAAEWQGDRRDRGDLYRGARLAGALEWRAEHEPELNEAEQAFLGASAAAQSRSRRRLQAVMAGLAVLLVLAAAAGIVALRQRGTALDVARTAQAQRLGAQALSEQALDRALLLAAEGVALEDTAVTRSNLLRVLQRSPAATWVMRRGGMFTAVDTSPDGRTVAVGNDSGQVMLVDPRTRSRIATIGAGISEVTDVRFSPDGSRLAIATIGTVVLVDARSRRELARSSAGVDRAVRTLAFSPDSATLAAAVSDLRTVGSAQLLGDPATAKEEMIRWDARSGRRLETVPRVLSSQGPALVDFASARHLIFVDARERVTTVRDADTLAVVRRFGVSGAPAAVSPDRRTLALAASDGSVRFLNLRTGVVRRAVGRHRERIRQMRFSADSRMLATASEGTDVAVWDAHRAASVETFSGHATSVAAASVTADRRTLYSVGLDGALIQWDLTGTRRLVRPFRVDHVGAFPPISGENGLLSSEDGGVFAVADDRGTVNVYDSRTLAVTRQIRIGRGPGSAIPLAIAPDGRTLAISLAGGSLVLADMRTGRTTELPGTRDVVSSAFSRDGRWLAVIDATYSLALWDRRGSIPKPVARTRTGTAGLTMRFHPSGRSVVMLHPRVEGHDFDLEEYSLPRLQRGRRIAVSGQFPAADFAPDGRTFAYGDRLGRTWLYDTSTWAPHAPPLEGREGPIGSVSFSPDGRQLATTSARGSVRLWDLTSEPPIMTALGSGDNHVTGFIQGGGHLITLSAYGRGEKWDLRPGEWLRRACAVAGRSLTRAEWREAMPGRSYAPACRP